MAKTVHMDDQTLFREQKSWFCVPVIMYSNPVEGTKEFPLMLVLCASDHVLVSSSFNAMLCVTAVRWLFIASACQNTHYTGKTDLCNRINGQRGLIRPD